MLGYLLGSFGAWIEALIERIRELGGELETGRPVQRIVSDAGRVGLELAGEGQETVLFDAVVATAETVVKKNGNRLRVEVDPSLGSMRADLTKVRQALFNLLSNAAKFTREGEIALVVAQETRDDVPRVRMSVSDTGIGIPTRSTIASSRSSRRPRTTPVETTAVRVWASRSAAASVG